MWLNRFHRKQAEGEERPNRDGPSSWGNGPAPPGVQISRNQKRTEGEREVTATNRKEKGHARPWQAALARTMKTTTGHGELFPVERTSRPPGPHGQALLGLDSHKSRSAPAAGCDQGKELAAAWGYATPSRPAAMRLRGTRAGAALPRSTPYGSADLETKHEE